MTSRRVTIVDIARELGISKSLVSNALHNRGRVSAATRELVQAKAQDMGYVSNRAAQQLRSSRSGTIGLTIPSDLRALSFYMQITLGVSDACGEFDSDLMLYTHYDSQSRVSLNVPLDGVIVCDPKPSDPLITQFTQADIPIVTIGHVDSDQDAGIDGSVSIDFSKLVGDVFASLDSRGEGGSPALLIPNLPVLPVWLEEVHAAYVRECGERNITPREVPLPISVNLPAGAAENSTTQTVAGPMMSTLRDFVAELLDSSQSAWIVAFQGLASTLRGLAVEVERNDDIPRIVALPGDPMSDAFEPRILSVDFRAHDYGVTAAKMLASAIENRDDNRAAGPPAEIHRTALLDSR